MNPRASADTNGGLEQALTIIDLLARGVGPRRPTSTNERIAAEAICAELRANGLDAALEDFPGLSTFAAYSAPPLALALLPALLPRHRSGLRGALAISGTLLAAIEDSLTHTPLADLLAGPRSQNLVAAIEPSDQPLRTVCLQCHLDSSRSGVLFHPRFVPHLQQAIGFASAAMVIQAGEPLLARSRPGRLALRAARLLIAGSLGLLIERELRGEDVPGANDNASGVAVAATLAMEGTRQPLRTTRLVLLATGCEESGLVGSHSFLRSHDTSGWLFLNFDTVGGPGRLRYLRREGVPRKRPADPQLVELAAGVSTRRPDLGLAAGDGDAGLSWDSTPVLARGGRALTFTAYDRVLPNYHAPTDTPENLDPDVVRRAIEAGREMLAAIDRGEADR